MASQGAERGTERAGDTLPLSIGGLRVEVDPEASMFFGDVLFPVKGVIREGLESWGKLHHPLVAARAVMDDANPDDHKVEFTLQVLIDADEVGVIGVYGQMCGCFKQAARDLDREHQEILDRHFAIDLRFGSMLWDFDMPASKAVDMLKSQKTI